MAASRTIGLAGRMSAILAFTRRKLIRIAAHTPASSTLRAAAGADRRNIGRRRSSCNRCPRPRSSCSDGRRNPSEVRSLSFATALRRSAVWCGAAREPMRPRGFRSVYGWLAALLQCRSLQKPNDLAHRTLRPSRAGMLRADWLAVHTTQPSPSAAAAATGNAAEPAKLPPRSVLEGGSAPRTGARARLITCVVRVPSPEALEACPTCLAMTLFVPIPRKGRSFPMNYSWSCLAPWCRLRPLALGFFAGLIATESDNNHHVAEQTRL